LLLQLVLRAAAPLVKAQAKAGLELALPVELPEGQAAVVELAQAKGADRGAQAQRLAADLELGPEPEDMDQVQAVVMDRGRAEARQVLELALALAALAPVEGNTVPDQVEAAA